MNGDNKDRYEEAILSAIHTRFASLPTPQVMVMPTELGVLGMAFRPDMFVKAGDIILLVEVKERLSIEDVARAFLFSHLIRQQDLLSGRFEYVLMAKAVPKGVREMAPEVGVTVLRIDQKLRLPRSTLKGRPTVTKLSNQKSWRVVACLLRIGPASIREVSLRTEVSYGWAYATVSRMEQMGLATRTRDGVAITDMDKLLNGVAWERPLKSLWLDVDQKIAGNDLLEAGRTLSGYLAEIGIAHAFTGPTAGGLYSGYAHRFDRLYVYLDHEDPILALGPLEDPYGAISVTVIRADRDVFTTSEESDGLILASEAQTLLDLAGMGASAWDLTLEVARHYASTNGR